VQLYLRNKDIAYTGEWQAKIMIIKRIMSACRHYNLF
jgi:hypothetical protein